MTTKTFRRLPLVLLMLAAGLLTACGRTEDNRSLGIDGFVYMAEEVTLPEGEFMASSLTARDGYLYYQTDRTLMQLPLDKTESDWGENSVPVLKIPSAFGDSYRIRDYTAGNNGDLYYCRQNWIMEPGKPSVSEDHVLLIRQTADGDILYETPIPVTDIMSELICDLAVDGEGRAYLLAEDRIYVVDASGEVVGTISMENYTQDQALDNRGRFLEGAGGQVYFTFGYLDATLYKVIADGSFRLEEQNELKRNMSGFFLGSPYGLLCDNTDGILYQYHDDDSSWHPLLRWTDGNVSGTTGMVFQLSEDCIAAAYSTMNGSLAAKKYENSLYLLTKTAVSELPEKEILVLAAIYPSSGLQQSVMDFNQTSSQYHIVLDIYEGDEATTRLDAAMVSSDPPDLLDISSLSFSKYSQKQALADLSPYLNQSEVLNREDFLPTLLDGYTVDGKLYSIPGSFTLTTIMGRPDQIGSDAGWTMADVMALTEKYPDDQLINRNNFYYILNFLCSEYILTEYIDWEKGICRFDNPEFRELIQWIWDHSEESGRMPANGSVNYFYGPVPKNLLLVRKQVISPYEYALEIAEMGGDVTTMIGYPTTDGHQIHEVSAKDALCITASSRHKKAAWEFVEFFLSQDLDLLLMNAFPTRLETLLDLIEEEATPTYLLSENGEILYENGEPMIQTRMVVSRGETRIEYKYLEREHADALLEIIKHIDFTPDDSRKNTAAAIISEELDSWLNQDKSLEEATAIIQSRVQLMLNEGV